MTDFALAFIAAALVVAMSVWTIKIVMDTLCVSC